MLCCVHHALALVSLPACAARACRRQGMMGKLLRALFGGLNELGSVPYIVSRALIGDRHVLDQTALRSRAHSMGDGPRRGQVASGREARESQKGNRPMAGLAKAGFRRQERMAAREGEANRLERQESS